MSKNGRAILFVLPSHAFRQEEYETARAALEQRGLKVVVASTVPDGVTGSRGETVATDLLIDQVNPEDYAGVVLIGGHGASQYWYDYKVHEILRAHARAGKPIAAIDRATVALGAAGLLKGKKVTGHISVFEKLANFGADYTGSKVERDGNLLTAEGASAVSLFAGELAKTFSGN
ncbi:MAG: DJ-1/PfpI family protein [candidate division KSB1 bacterium]|nr:DJ-1/PfpI family protein [candidate division KSB1 bacterium]MDZ7272743.1 DJ-1/PfpI family protein [candidate division KSB1 bacterium]MDZ7284232.1 DJ-1/PfpI family protein [candidate division KSB1 bacterium]MDZ7297369.1 DJ-1/PfpI family protein [candidate division KSB1 bacterium]MDZ7309057.1 DJ-1/PfpI family protein [candidate division KSB1 bacterium]